jgi:hypothetical protein
MKTPSIAMSLPKSPKIFEKLISAVSSGAGNKLGNIPCDGRLGRGSVPGKLQKGQLSPTYNHTASSLSVSSTHACGNVAMISRPWAEPVTSGSAVDRCPPSRELRAIVGRIDGWLGR